MEIIKLKKAKAIVFDCFNTLVSNNTEEWKKHEIIFILSNNSKKWRILND
jgi:FMN phosphatase YigB (HAD superfamily)